MNQRKQLEHLCYYIARPAIANERLTLNDVGQVVLMLKAPYQDGTSHIVLSPDFMQRLAALVPRPRLNLIRLHGVLAPNVKLRAEIIPQSNKEKCRGYTLNLPLETGLFERSQSVEDRDLDPFKPQTR